ncbi:MAG: phage tail family protein [Clostridium sp.]|uniref:phage tail family protein n=1 Tax=Clostridium sp. TaxID=1506 RepID=UPI003D6C7C95
MDINITLKSNNKILEITKDTSYKLIEIEGIESAEFQLNITSNSQYDGSTVSSKRIDKRPIAIVADFKGENKEIEREKLISFFNPKYVGVLIVDYCGVEKAIEYEIESFKAPLTNTHDLLTFTADLICPNPYWTDLLESKEEIALWKPDFSFPLKLSSGGIKFGHREPSLIVNVANLGNTECGMRVEFKALATLTNPSILNVNTREFIKINKTIVAGEVISVSTYFGDKNIKSTLNGVTTNAINFIDFQSTFLQLDVGDNLFRYNADTNLDNLVVNIYYRPQYLGV